MNPLAWLNPGRWMLYIALVAACALFVRMEYARVDERGYARAAGVYELALAKQKTAAAATLAKVTEDALERERLLRAALSRRENEDAKNSELLAKAVADARALSRSVGGPGLRDPYALTPRGWGSGGGAPGPANPGASDRPANPAEAAGLLSVELENFLLDRFAEADAINLAYISCRADALSIRSPP